MGSTRFLSKRWYQIGLASISLFALWVYMPGIENGFAVGDFMHRVPEIAFPEMLSQVLITSRSQLVYWLFNWILSRIFVNNPIGYRVVLLGLHILSGLVLSDLARRMTGDRRVGLVAFLLFALYPRNHQVLLWSVTNNKVMGTLFLLACMDFTLQFRQENRTWQGLLAALFAMLALLTSGGNLALFILLPLLWVIFRNEEILYFDDQTIKGLLALAVLAIGFGLITVDWGWNLLASGDRVPLSGLSEGYQFQPISLATLKDFLVYNTYLLLPFIPLRSLDPSILTSLLAGFCFFFLVAVFGVGIKLPRFAVVWMVVGILPYVLFVPFGNADRYFYLAAAGYALLMGHIAMRLYDIVDHPRHQMGTAELVILCLLGVYVVAGTLSLRARVNEWRVARTIATRVTQETFSQHPDPLGGHRMLFVNLPMTYGQAYVYLNGGISEEISKVYRENRGVTVEAYQVRDPDVIAYVEELPAPSWEDETDLTIFLYENGRLIEKDSASADLDLLKPTLWNN